MKRKSKRSGKLKRWRKKLALNMRSYLIALLCLGVVGAGIWNASRNDGAPAQEVDFGDSLTSATARSTSRASYEDALALAAEGKMAEARVVIERLAPLSDVADQPLGNGAAHLWLAQYLLGDFNSEFLQVFPLDSFAGHPSVAPALFRDEKVQAKIKKHLEHAVALSPELEDAHQLLASIHLANGMREKAISQLMSGLGYAGDDHGVGVHDALLWGFANASTFKGDELALKELMWLEFSTLGREVAESSKAGLSTRLEYAASALMIQKFEVVEIVTQKIERDFKGSRREPSAVKVAHSLRGAIHYFRAIHLLDAAHQAGDYSAVAKELAAAQKLDPGNVHIIDALRQMASRYPGLRSEIKKLLEQEGKTQPKEDGSDPQTASSSASNPKESGARADHLMKSGARTHFLLSQLSDSSADLQRHLKIALENAPNDPEILLAYVQAQLRAEGPPYSELRELLDRAAAHAGDTFGQMAELYLARGQVFLGLDDKNAAIAALEQALSSDAKDKKMIHALLAKAYQQAGYSVMAAAHQERS